MTQARLTHMAILHCHREISLDVDAILREFIWANELRRRTFGKPLSGHPDARWRRWLQPPHNKYKKKEKKDHNR